MRRLRPFAALLLVALATVTFAGRALGQQSDKQQQLQQQVSEASAAEQSARAQLVQAQAERQRIEASLADVSSRLDAANERLTAAQAQVDRLGFIALVLQAKVDVTQKKLATARNDVRHSAVLLYRHGDGAHMIGLLGSTDGSGQLVEGTHYLQRVSDKRQDDARRVTKLKDQLESQQQDVAAQKQVADAGARGSRRREGEARRARGTAAARARRRRGGGAGRERRARHRGGSATSRPTPSCRRSRRRSRRSCSRSATAPHSATARSSGRCTGSITSGFGYRTDPVTGATAYHAGIDIGASCGTPIKAAGTGSVISAGFNSGGYGNMTLINHGNGQSTLYGHQSSIIVSAGQSVTQGQVIGYVGSTGKSTGCHLHFEVRVNGNPVDPTATSRPVARYLFGWGVRRR